MATKAPGATCAGSKLERALGHAEQLLAYASEAGIEVDRESAQRIVAATRSKPSAWDSSDAGALMVAISKVAKRVSPVTAESLEACRTKAPRQILTAQIVAATLAFFIVPLSGISFLTSGLCNSIATDLRTANQLAVTLHADLDAPVTAGGTNTATASSSTLTDLQKFAALTRSIRDHASLLNTFLVWGSIPYPPGLGQLEPRDYELDPALKFSAPAFASEANAKTGIYQMVRQYSQDVRDNSVLFYGAITSILLPVLYALLGACAYLLRLFSEELMTKTFETSSYAVSARIFIALIGGMIVGLFSNFGSGASLPPLALAFLVGYASDAFFSFLDGLLSSFQSTGKRRAATGPRADQDEISAPAATRYRPWNAGREAAYSIERRRTSGNGESSASSG